MQFFINFSNKHLTFSKLITSKKLSSPLHFSKQILNGISSYKNSSKAHFSLQIQTKSLLKTLGHTVFILKNPS